MLIVMKPDATDEQIANVVQCIRDLGYEARPMPGRQRTTVGLVGNDGKVDDTTVAGLAGVAEVIHVSKPYKQVSREWKPEPTRVSLPDGSSVGGRGVGVVAGPWPGDGE